MDQALTAAISAVAGTALTALGSFLLNRKKLTADLNETMRQRIFDETEKFRATLQSEIVTLRERMVKLEEDKLRYAIENAELRTRIKDLESDLSLLRRFVADKLQTDPTTVLFPSGVKE